MSKIGTYEGGRRACGSLMQQQNSIFIPYTMDYAAATYRFTGEVTQTPPAFYSLTEGQTMSKQINPPPDRCVVERGAFLLASVLFALGLIWSISEWKDVPPYAVCCDPDSPVDMGR
jgi:hypothetical protein